MITSGRVVALSSVVGLLAISFIAMNQAANEHRRWQEVEKQKQQLEANADLEQTKAETTKRTADAYRKNQVLKPETLIVKDYVFNTHTPPRLDWQHSVDPSLKTWIYDQFRQCVGYAYGGIFYWAVKDGQIDYSICKDVNP